MERKIGQEIQVFADTADLSLIRNFAADARIRGFTTNPTLLLKSGVGNYETFIPEVLDIIGERPISLEVFADDPISMYHEGKKLARFSNNIYIKIPITTSTGASTNPAIQLLVEEGIPVNITAIFTLKQVERILPVVAQAEKVILSVFAGRIADTGRDPIPMMRELQDILVLYPHISSLWASAREILNVQHAITAGTDIITLPPALLEKLSCWGRDLEEFSLETVRGLQQDALQVRF